MKILTADELMQLNNGNDYTHYEEIEQLLITFAKLHVEAALKAASEVELIHYVDYESGDVSYYQNDTGILNAYPLTNIK